MLKQFLIRKHFKRIISMKIFNFEWSILNNIVFSSFNENNPNIH